MKCPYLLINRRARRASLTSRAKHARAVCEAGERPYAPTVFQLHEYCMDKDHRKCPFYLSEALRAVAIQAVSCA